MSLYVHVNDAAALNSIDLKELEALVDEAVWQSRSSALRGIRLASCGEYVSGRLSKFDQAIAAHNKAKANKKRAETAAQVHRAGADIVRAVREMKRRIEEEQREQELFVVEDCFLHLREFTPEMNIRIAYRWRNAIDEAWTRGSINFLHEVDTRPHHTFPTPKRKPSRAKQEDDLQDRLYRVWNHLRWSALHSVREYLKSGRDRSAIPESFKVTTDPCTRSLNNFSTRFWHDDS